MSTQQLVLLLTGVGLLISIVINVGTAAYVYGKLTNKVATHETEIERLRKEDDRLWAVSNHNSSDIANLRGRMQLNGEAKKAAH